MREEGEDGRGGGVVFGVEAESSEVMAKVSDFFEKDSLSRESYL